ncbi:MAG: class I SAM-dependent methyltransferase, partial [Caldimonas sp.]
MTPPQHPSAASAVAAPPLTTSMGAEPVVVVELRRRLQGATMASFDVHLPDRRVFRIGSEPASFALHLRTPSALAALTSFDEFAVASAYMNGEIDFEGEFLAALDLRRAMTDWHPFHSLWRHLRPMLFGQVATDKLWVQQHYDYGNDFYFAFLDKRVRLYSQALYRSDGQSLEDAAEQKLEYVFRSCRLGPGSHVLDIGAGWGSFAGYASRRGANVTMLTISKEQYEYQRGLVAAQSSPGTLETVFESVCAYRSPRKYDAIVLLGVMEHLPDYARLFAVFQRLMK